MYKLTNNSNVMLGSLVIPNDATNADRIKYDAWISEGNTPDPADPVVVTVG
jgi:hypothetical protein